MTPLQSAHDGAIESRPVHQGRGGGPPWLVWLAWAALAGVILAAIALLALQRPSVATGLVNGVLGRVAPAGSTLTVERVSGNWLSRLEVCGFRMSRSDTLVASVDTLRIHYWLVSLLGGRVHVSDLQLSGAFLAGSRADTTRRAAPKAPLTLADLLRGRFYRGPSLRLDRISVRDGRFQAADRGSGARLHLSDVTVQAYDVRLRPGFSFRLDSLAMRVASGDPAEAADTRLVARLRDGRFEAQRLRWRSAASDVAGDLMVALGPRDSLAEGGLTLVARPLALRDLAGFLPGAALEGNVVADVDLRGSSAARLGGTVAVSAERARVGPIDLGPSRLDATMVDGRADTRLTARYQGATIGVGGWIRPFDASPAYDLEARCDRLPARIPGAPWWPALAGRTQAAVMIRATGSGYADAACDVTARVDGDAGHIDLDGRLDLARERSWTIRRLGFTDLDAARLAGQTTTASAINGTLVAEGRALSPRDRRLSGELTLGPSRYGRWSLSRANVQVTMKGSSVAGGLEVESETGQVTIKRFTARWDGDGGFRIDGARFRGVDLGRISGGPSLASRLDGSLSARGRGLSRLRSPGGPTLALRKGRVSGEARVELTPSRFRDAEITRAAARVTLADGRARVVGDVTSPAGRLDLEAEARPFATPATVTLTRGRFANLDLSAWSGVAALRSHLSGTVTGGGHPAAAPGPGEEWRAALQLDPSTFGNAALEGGDARASLTDGTARVVGGLRVSGDTVTVNAEAALRDSTPHGRAQVRIPFGLLAAAMGRDSLAAQGALEARAAFVGRSPATAIAEGTVSGLGTIGRARLDSLIARFRLERGTLELDTLAASSNVALLTGSGRVALDTTASATSDVRIILTAREVAALRPLLDADTLAIGAGTVSVRLGGSGAERNLDLSGQVRSLAWNDLRLLGATVSARGSLDRGWRITSGSSEISLNRLRAPAIRLNQSDVRARFANGELGFDVTAEQDERRGVHVVGSARRDSLGTVCGLSTLEARADSMVWALARPARVELRADRLEVRDFDVRSQWGRFVAQGRIDRRGDQDFRLDVEGVSLATLLSWFGREGPDGILSGNLALSGPAAAPVGQAGIRLDLASGQEPAGGLRSRLAWQGSGIDFRGGFTAATGESLSWSGHLPMALSLAVSDSATGPWRTLEGDVDIQVRAARFPLGALSPLVSPRSVAGLAGTLDMDTRLQGTSQALKGSGRAEVAGGAITLPGLGVTYRDIGFRGGLQDDRLIVHAAGAASGKGQLSATGEVRFVSVTRIEPRLNVKATRFVFAQTADLKATGSGDVTVTGTLTAPVVKGTVTAEDVSYTITPTDQAASGGSEIRLTDADVQMMEETFGFVEAGSGNPALQLYDASDLDLSITLARNNWVRQNVQPKLAVALTGTVRLRKEPHTQPQLFGRIAPVPDRGYVEQFARSFDISGGEVLLNGDMKDHAVNVQAQYKPPSTSNSDETEVIIRLDVQGTPEKLRLLLSSEPAMSEVEIVNYIATGRSQSVHTGPSDSESSASLARDIGLAQVTGIAGSAAQKATGLDVVQVRFDALQGATLVAGRYLDPKLYVGFLQPLQYKDAGSPTSTTTYSTSVELEYAIQSWLVLNLKGETSRLRSFIRVRHAF